MPQPPKTKLSKPATAAAPRAQGLNAKGPGDKAASVSAADGKAASSKVLNARSLTEGQRTYEAKRAAKAGMSLDKWLASKQRELEAEAKAKLKAAEAPKPAKAPGFFSRLLERAQRPLGS